MKWPFFIATMFGTFSMTNPRAFTVRTDADKFLVEGIARVREVTRADLAEALAGRAAVNNVDRFARERFDAGRVLSRSLQDLLLVQQHLREVHPPRGSCQACRSDSTADTTCQPANRTPSQICWRRRRARSPLLSRGSTPALAPWLLRHNLSPNAHVRSILPIRVVIAL